MPVDMPPTSLANKGTQNFKWVEMTPGKAFPKGTEYKVATAGGKQRTFAKIPNEVVQNAVPETPTMGKPPIEPPGATTGATNAIKTRIREKGNFVPTEADDVAIDNVVRKLKSGELDTEARAAWTPEEIQTQLNWKKNIEARLNPGKAVTPAGRAWPQLTKGKRATLADKAGLKHPFDVAEKEWDELGDAARLIEEKTTLPKEWTPAKLLKAARTQANPTGQVTFLPRSYEQSVQKLKTQLVKAERITPELEASIKQQQAIRGTSIDKARNIGGEAGYRASFGESAASSREISLASDLSSGHLDTLQREVDDWAAFRETVLKGKESRQGFTWQHASDGLHKLMGTYPGAEGKAIRPYDFEMDALKSAIPDIVDSPLGHMPTAVETVYGVGKFMFWDTPLDLTKAMRAMLDDSAILRQGFVLATGHPLEAGLPGLKESLIDAFSPSHYGKLGLAIEEHPFKPIFDHFKMEFTGMGEEELFRNRLIKSIPIVKSVYNASERAFSGGLNKMRLHAASEYMAAWMKKYPEYAEAIMKEAKLPTGKTAEMAELSGRAGGWLVNASSGRGSLGPFQHWAPFLRDTLWTPQLYSARLQYFPVGFGKAFNMFVQSGGKDNIFLKMYAQQFAGMSLFTGATLTGLYYAGADIELDPRSTDFLKAKIGNTHIDLTGGFQQYFRYAAQIAGGERKAADGKIVESNRLDSFMRLLRSKEAPAVAFVHDVLAGQSMIGEEVGLNKETTLRYAYQSFTPFFVQDVADAVKDAGPAKGAALAAPGFFGGGVLTYPNAEKSTNQPAMVPLTRDQIIENQVWAQYPYWKVVNDQIALAVKANPGMEASLLKKHPKLVQIRKEIVKRKRMAKLR
jgi:hypothetical protein